MEVSQEKQKDFVIIKLKGEFDLSELPVFEKEINKARQESNKIIVDFSQLEYIDSGGIGAFIQLQTDLGNEDGGELYLYNVNDFIYGVLDVANLLTFFTLLNHEQKNDLLK